MLKQVESEQVSARLTQRERDKIDELVSMGFYLNRSDFIRQLVRKELGTIEVIDARKVPIRQARKMIEDYYKKHPVAYPSDVAADLGIDLNLVFKVAKKMGKEGVLSEGVSSDRA